jgi:hypothetical protein
MRRREFITTVAAMSAVAALPLTESYDCQCGAVTYRRQNEGHFAATHFAGKRMSYQLHRYHLHLHQLPRAEMLARVEKFRAAQV